MVSLLMSNQNNTVKNTGCARILKASLCQLDAEITEM